jgi:hypothetical protein
METGPRREGEPSESDYSPDFVFPHHDAITETNWPEWTARGIRPVAGLEVVSDQDLPRLLKMMQGLGGVEHVYTGDAFDLAEGRPLANKPGTGIYATEEAIRRQVEAKQDLLRTAAEIREEKRQQDQADAEPEGPGSN